jgi:uncharacterized lipoprotein YajG
MPTALRSAGVLLAAILFLYFGAKAAVAIDSPTPASPKAALPPEHPVFATIVVVCTIKDSREASHVSVVVATYASGKSLRITHEPKRNYGLTEDQAMLDYGRLADDFEVWTIGCPAGYDGELEDKH